MGARPAATEDVVEAVCVSSDKDGSLLGPEVMVVSDYEGGGD